MKKSAHLLELLFPVPVVILIIVILFKIRRPEILYHYRVAVKY